MLFTLSPMVQEHRRVIKVATHKAACSRGAARVIVNLCLVTYWKPFLAERQHVHEASGTDSLALYLLCGHLLEDEAK